MVLGNPTPNMPGSPARSFSYPVGVQSLILSTSELDSGTTLTTKKLESMSVVTVLKPSADSHSSIEFPLVQGMGLLSGIYTELQPKIQSGVGIQSLMQEDMADARIVKYVIQLIDKTHWVLYAIGRETSSDVKFLLETNSTIVGPSNWSGLIQIAKLSQTQDNYKFYDLYAGSYAISGKLSGSVEGRRGTYALSWTKKSYLPEPAHVCPSSSCIFIRRGYFGKCSGCSVTDNNQRNSDRCEI